MSHENICQHCGACCAYFRVSFYWGESDPLQGGKVPPEMTEEENEFFNNMLGTNQSHPYCQALEGKIGGEVSCAIYENRPSPCSDFGIHYVHGKIEISREELQRCNKARAGWNLPPLVMEELIRGNDHQGSTSFPEHLSKSSARKPHSRTGLSTNHPHSHRI